MPLLLQLCLCDRSQRTLRTLWVQSKKVGMPAAVQVWHGGPLQPGLPNEFATTLLVTDWRGDAH